MESQMRAGTTRKLKKRLRGENVGASSASKILHTISAIRNETIRPEIKSFAYQSTVHRVVSPYFRDSKKNGGFNEQGEMAKSQWEQLRSKKLARAASLPNASHENASIEEERDEQSVFSMKSHFSQITAPMKVSPYFNDSMESKESELEGEVVKDFPKQLGCQKSRDALISKSSNEDTVGQQSYNEDSSPAVESNAYQSIVHAIISPHFQDLMKNIKSGIQGEMASEPKQFKSEKSITASIARISCENTAIEDLDEENKLLVESNSPQSTLSIRDFKKNEEFDMKEETARDMLERLGGVNCGDISICKASNENATVNKDRHEDGMLTSNSQTRFFPSIESSENIGIVVSAINCLAGHLGKRKCRKRALSFGDSYPNLHEQGKNHKVDDSGQDIGTMGTKVMDRFISKDKFLKGVALTSSKKASEPNKVKCSRGKKRKVVRKEKIQEKRNVSRSFHKKRKATMEKTQKVLVFSRFFAKPTSCVERNVLSSKGQSFVDGKTPFKLDKKEFCGNEEGKKELLTNAKKKSNHKSIYLSLSQKRDTAYRKKSYNNDWKAPSSIYSLLQENHAHDPWRVLVICTLLNCTTGKQVKKILPDFFALCPDAKTAMEVDINEIREVIKPLGLYNKRAELIPRLSKEYLEGNWEYVTELPGVGKYGADAYAMFCNGDWDRVQPEDQKLNLYWQHLSGYVDPADLSD